MRKVLVCYTRCQYLSGLCSQPVRTAEVDNQEIDDELRNLHSCQVFLPLETWVRQTRVMRVM